METDDFLALNGALSQADRVRAAPAPGRVKIDGRSFAELLAFAAEYGRLITFYDLADTPDGDWSAFFASDPTIRLAMRVSLETETIQRDLDAALARLDTAEDSDARRRHAAPALAAIRKLAQIHGGDSDPPDSFDRMLATLTRSERSDVLNAPAQQLRHHLGRAAPEHAVHANGGEWTRIFVERLDALGSALLTALSQDRDAAIAAIEASLDAGQHPPQSALYAAFAVLFGHAQTSINRFPARLQQFYHADILRQTTRAGTPDRVCLTCTAADDVAHVALPAGTRFTAGTDPDGATIGYALEDALSVGEARVAALNTLGVSSARASPKLPPMPAQVLTGDVVLAEKPPEIRTPFPILGADAPGTNGALITRNARLGFALASPTLMLAGGTRTVTIGMTLTEASRAEIWDLCRAIGTAAGGMAPDAVFCQLVAAAFTLRYSSLSDWVAISGGYSVTPIGESEPRFTLAVTLDPDAGPCAALADDVDPALLLLPDQTEPVLVADLVQTLVSLSVPGSEALTLYPYAIVAPMVLARVTIDVAVRGLTELAASSPGGPVDTSQPFALFGSPPVRYSTFEIAAPELFAKPVTAVTLDIGWYGLPVTARGFGGYYQAYVVDADGVPIPPDRRYANDSFRAALTLANPGCWQLKPAGEDYYLFRAAEPPDAKLQPLSSFAAEAIVQSPPPYYDPAASVLRLTLTAPETAFGDLLYPPNVMDASVKLTAAAAACAQHCGSQPKPHPPVFEPIRQAIAKSPDATLEADIKSAVEEAAAQLNDEAIHAIDRLLAARESAGGADAGEMRERFAAALGTTRPNLGQRLRRLWRSGAHVAETHARLHDWLAEHAADLSDDSVAACVAAAGTLLAIPASIAGRNPGAIRSAAGDTLDQAHALLSRTGATGDDCIHNCLADAGLTGFPNQPWLPMAARVAITYSASAQLPQPPELPAEGRYWHILPAGPPSAVDLRSGAQPLLVPVKTAGALLIELSAPATVIDLFVRLTPPPGGWPVDTPRVAWMGCDVTGDWQMLTMLSDTTQGLRNSGIVRLATRTENAPVNRLRVSVSENPSDFPDLAALATNAGTAVWVGPGGGAALGTPLPAGSITQPLETNPALGSVDQPMPSAGGAPALAGSAFDLWIAERLRHKNRGIQGRDYADLTLAAFPALWQVAVVPASEGHVARAPGSVWVVPVPGRDGAAIADPTAPSNDSQTLTAIADYLRTRISPFVQLWVTDPPYLRLRVAAELVFDDIDTVAGYRARLNADLVAFLSPWPPADMPNRPKDYYTTKQVAHFIRSRPYVLGILKLAITPATGMTAEGGGWHYLTSVAEHAIDGRTQPRTNSALTPKLSRSTSVAMAGEAA